jgi:twinkle protein
MATAVGLEGISMKTLGQIGLDFFESRGISLETAARFEIYTASRPREGGQIVPDPNGNIIVFPFLDNGVVVAEKYRAPGKRFWQRTGGRRTFWNATALDDPALADGHLPLVITEGEIDALTAIDCGFPLAVSVPDGAPGVPEGQSPDELEPINPTQENKGKFEFLFNNQERLKRVKRFILAVDNDPPGRRLAAELERRLSAWRCFFVTYPEGCKDLNEVLVRHGRDAVTRVLEGARPYPVRGLYRLSEYPERDALETFSTGWWTLDPHLMLFPGEFMVVTGVPGHGKSTWVLNLLVNLAKKYGWTSAVFSPEMPTVPHLRDKLRRMISDRWTTEVDQWIEQHFVFIGSDPTGRHDDDFDLDWLLDRATDAVLRDGVRVLLIDPWNEIEHARRRDETVTDYIGRSIRALKRFAQQYAVAVIIVAHPTKDVGKDGKARPVTLYDIDGSAHWFNKCDHGVIITREPEIDVAEVFVAKVRFQETGEKGTVRLRFDRLSERFHLLSDVPTQTAA